MLWHLRMELFRCPATSSGPHIADVLEMDGEYEEAASTAPLDQGVEDVRIEILAPVHAAEAALARALRELSCMPTGLFLGVSERGTLLLNQTAWATFHSALDAVVDLQTRRATDVSTRSLRICVRT